MTETEFRNTFYGPRNKANRAAMCGRYDITGFAGLSLSRMGWTGFVDALGDRFGLDARKFSCHAAFMDALAARVSLKALAAERGSTKK